MQIWFFTLELKSKNEKYLKSRKISKNLKNIEIHSKNLEKKCYIMLHHGSVWASLNQNKRTLRKPTLTLTLTLNPNYLLLFFAIKFVSLS